MANILNYSGEAIQKYVSRHLLFILYVVLLLIIYIGTRYNEEKAVTDIYNLSKEISEAQKRYLQIKTAYQHTTQMTYIDSKLEPIGVGISKEPIKDIIIYEDSIKNSESK
ncbi:MAG: FtsL-like putative cell division protein [Bacteroidota bacterium]|nr:FtsL-like putative cell division protein [Bacteroidota bacterium]